MDSIDAARFQWDDGERRLKEADASKGAMEMVTGRIIEELRRRLGGPFMPSELVTLYEQGTDWCLELAMAAAPSNPEAWDGLTVADAAFGRYLREATDYAGGRIVQPYERDQS